ncbi:MAG: UvrD-helicase domain-containing protein [Gemmatimonadales bacterium]
MDARPPRRTARPSTASLAVVALPLPDRDARAAIGADLDTNLLVEAGAGSGKTTELVTRMVALLETGTARADEIAAVTFTRKAAGELRERFQAALETRIAELRAAGATSDIAFERLVTGLDEIERSFVGTIHAFCARLLRERPLEVGLDPAFEEMEPDERLFVRQRFWQSYLERLARESDPILEELTRTGLRPGSLRGLFDAVVENPDVEFPAEPSITGSAQEIADVRAVMEDLVERARELMPERIPDSDWDPLQKKIRSLLFLRDVTGWTEPADVYEALGQLCKQSGSHKIVQKRWRHAARAKALRDEIDAFAVGDAPARRLYLRWLAHRYALAVRLARSAAAEFTAHRHRTGKLDFQDLLVLAAELLRTRPEVRRDLGTRYRRVLLDEFQDTDPLQAEIVLLLASEPDAQTEEGGAPGGVGAWMRAVPRPGALFVVGDPKQSIYRFRRADIQLYALVQERFREFGRVVELTTNFRSRPAIGDVVNELFPTEGFFPAEATAEQAAFEPLNTRPPSDPVPSEGVFTYDLQPLEKNQSALARDDSERIASWIRARVDRGERRPGDFLVLARNKARLGAYARALEARDLPVEVTGAGVGAEEEIRELLVLLRCMIDPTNPVRVVAALVGLCFGIDYERLVVHRLEGGGLDAMAPGERGHPDVLDALRTLHTWWRRAIRQPSDIFVPGLVSELGLLPLAAAGELGSVRAGALVFVLDAVRAAALAGDSSLPGAIVAIEGALELAEAEAPLEPARPDVVRVMNLHQAKGLEAPVVILADPCGGGPHAPDLHVERGDAGAVAHARVVDAGEGWAGSKDLARPTDWDAMAEIEARFEAAEAVRLLYVAVTRAKHELVVARWPDKPAESPWRALDPWLDRRATRLELEASPPPVSADVAVTADEIQAVAARGARILDALRTPSYVHRAVTDVTEAGLGAPVREAPARADAPASSVPVDARPAPQRHGARGHELRGYEWGSAVHGALAAAARAPGAQALRATCRDLLVEHGRPLDDHGEPLELAELVELVRSVEGSDLWMRAMRADRVLSEVPFALPGWIDDARAPDVSERAAAAPARKQLDLFGGSEGGGRTAGNGAPEASGQPPTLLEGVIDLAFHEADGWVVADYKTDVGTDPEFAAREVAYRRQVEIYADAWARLTGERVKERVIFFTAQGRTERW